ncbi:MAG: RHS repeat-associated core domain-containing protein [Parabacteroides sp.]|nr:RHS repeat-associated core domain-containing protein [Parabacteroides sp.]
MIPTNTTKCFNFEYDYQGRRIAKKVWNNTAGTGTPATYLKYLYDGWNLIAELNGNSGNALVRAYTWGLDASGSMQGAGGVGGLLMVNAGSGGVHFPAYDLNGNVMGLVNATNGIISAKYEYGPFGEVFCSVGDMAKVNPFQFSTKYTDNETDLVYYGYRYYSPALGRWLSRDPIEERGGLNLYGFVNNDPVNRWDVLGLWEIERKRKRWAIATAGPGDTFDDLGRMLKLDTKDYKAWAHTDHNYAISGCTYKIPNTIFIEFGEKFGTFFGIKIDKFGPIPAWQQYAKDDGENWKRWNFYVVINDPSSPELAESDLKDDYIYGFIYVGHGNTGYEFVFKGGEETGTSLSSARYTKYGINFLYAFGCNLADETPKHKSLGYNFSEWEVNVAKRGRFVGTWGEVDGHQTWDRMVFSGGANLSK